MPLTEQSRAHVRGARRADLWRLARVGLAIFFVAAGTARTVAPPVDPLAPAGASRMLLAALEIGGGLLLFVPQLATVGAAVLAAASGALGLALITAVNGPPAWPVLLIALALVAVGYACRPGARARARLERAIDRFMNLHETRARRGSCD
ncbi:hypothetical protein [Frigoriglobus tundricola]|uniref:DoxX family protein n=1 Tax=Frigoriglobus tundricola TaxID=2774151 RepID=A0A6M5YP96_9BACT|nr:hypothetical protein [Frigoriglobus tundricola]QJW94792.1 hypothetical protein FTUN_2315 [Frigoriglobus tundricola]